MSDPLSKGRLSGRLVDVKRFREGYSDDKSGNPDPGSYGDENYALSFCSTSTKNTEIPRNNCKALGTSILKLIRVLLATLGPSATPADLTESDVADRARMGLPSS